jgi:hypothetical protein
VYRDLIQVESGGTPAELTVTALNVEPAYIYPGEATQVTATVANYGGSWGSDTMALLVNGYLEQEDGVGLAPGTSEVLSFTVYRTEPGKYQVTLGDAVAVFYVMDEGEEAPQQANTGLLAGGTLNTGGIIAIICIAVILVAGIVVIFMFARRK